MTTIVALHDDNTGEVTWLMLNKAAVVTRVLQELVTQTHIQILSILASKLYNNNKLSNKTVQFCYRINYHEILQILEFQRTHIIPCVH